MLAPKPCPFPVHPALPIKRLPRRKYVTIAVGFNPSDGIVLCADTQETISSGFKRNQPKLEIRPHFHQHGTPCAVFAGAGDGPLVDHLIDKLWSKMAVSVSGIRKMIDAMENELLRAYKALVPCFHAGFMPEAHLLVGVWCPPDSLELVETSGPVLTRKIASKSIGCGETLSSYIEERLIAPKAELSDVIPVAIYIVDEAKKHVDGCGGETHVVTISASGKVERLHQFQVEPKTKKIEEIDRLARQIAAVAMNETVTDDAARYSIEQFVEDIIKIRQKP